MVAASCDKLAKDVDFMLRPRLLLAAITDTDMQTRMRPPYRSRQASFVVRLQDELQKLRVDAKTADKTIQRLQCQSEQKAQEAGGLNIKVC